MLELTVAHKYEFISRMAGFGVAGLVQPAVRAPLLADTSTYTELLAAGKHWCAMLIVSLSNGFADGPTDVSMAAHDVSSQNDKGKNVAQ